MSDVQGFDETKPLGDVPWLDHAGNVVWSACACLHLMCEKSQSTATRRALIRATRVLTDLHADLEAAGKTLAKKRP